MTYIPSLEPDDHLLHVLARFPKGLQPLLELHDAILRDDSQLTIEQRETIAAFVSATNACEYCHGAHRLFATQFGADPELIDAITSDLDAAPIDDPFRELLRYVGKLTREPAKLTQADADRVFAAGWDADALFDAVAVCALFNFMNRIVEGTGVKPISAEQRAALPVPPKRDTYVQLLDVLDKFRR